MKTHQTTFKVVGVLAVILAVVLGYIAFMFYKTQPHRTTVASPTSSDSRLLMTVTSSGGMCNGSCKHAVYNVYDNGKFEGHSELSSSEVADLKQIINSTDFTMYAPNPQPNCPSFVDGTDLVLLFPQKYGDRTFTTCMLEIPANDKAFTYINNLLQSHYIQKN